MQGKWMIAIAGFVLSAVATAQESKALSKEELAAQLPGVEVEDIGPSPMPGFYEIALGSNVAYVSTDGRYAFQGELFDLQTSENLTETTRSKARVGMLADVERAEMIVFSPPGGEVKHRVTVFTDIDCGYCRQFHREIDKVTALGIEVQYLFFPRTGPDTESWDKAERVWCANDRNRALTQAKLGGTVPEASCAENPVERHYDLGHLVGVRGTPAMYAQDGQQLGGYLTPAQLIEALTDASSSPQ